MGSLLRWTFEGQYGFIDTMDLWRTVWVHCYDGPLEDSMGSLLRWTFGGSTLIHTHARTRARTHGRFLLVSCLEIGHPISGSRSAHVVYITDALERLAALSTRDTQSAQ